VFISGFQFSFVDRNVILKTRLVLYLHFAFKFWNESAGNIEICHSFNTILLSEK